MTQVRLSALPGLWLGLLTVTLPGGALAGNFINVDAGTLGSVGALTITQDAAVTSNTISGAAGSSAPFTIAGTWRNIAINQAGADNQLTGGVRTSAMVPANNSFSASYTGGANHHSVKIGSVSVPSSVAETVNVANTGQTANTISEVLDSTGSLVNTLTIHGTGNSVTNTIAASSSISLNQIVGDGAANGTASGNTVINSTKSLGGAYAATVTVSGNGVTTGMNNAIANIADGSGGRTFNATVNGSSNNAIYNLLNGNTGTIQLSAALTTDTSTQAHYAVSANAAGVSSVNTTLTGVIGGIYVQQNGDVSGGDITLKVMGNGYSLGTLLAQQAQAAGMNTSGLPANFFGAGGANPGIAVVQSSSVLSSNPLTATVSVFAPGYTATITSSTH